MDITKDSGSGAIAVRDVINRVCPVESTSEYSSLSITGA